MRLFYNVGVRFYGLAIILASLFNEKARKWRGGRKGLFAELEKTFAKVNEPVVWFHCASLGEFEQGRPLIEAFRQKQSRYKILLTFFSPSGYEVRKNYPGADFIFFLPLDTPANAEKFIAITKPAVAVFIKYEFWFNYLRNLQEKNVPVYLVSAVFRADSYFFKGYAGWFRKQLHNYRKIFVQDAVSEQLLKKAGIESVEVAGDTRFDRVAAIAGQSKSDAVVEQFKGTDMLWICGSTWVEDEKLIGSVFRQLAERGEKIKLLLVPHETGEDHIRNILFMLPGAIRYSLAGREKLQQAKVMIVDAVGLLSSLYRYGDIAYIGGGFGKGIHNLPEAAVFGIPVIFGTNYGKFIEAGELLKRGGGFSIASENELLLQVIRFIKDKNYRETSGQAAKDYILSAQGATEKIIQAIINYSQGSQL